MSLFLFYKCAESLSFILFIFLSFLLNVFPLSPSPYIELLSLLLYYGYFCHVRWSQHKLSERKTWMQNVTQDITNSLGLSIFIGGRTVPCSG